MCALRLLITLLSSGVQQNSLLLQSAAQVTPSSPRQHILDLSG
jgi:hypothetical protein